MCNLRKILCWLFHITLFSGAEQNNNVKACLLNESDWWFILHLSCKWFVIRDIVMTPVWWLLYYLMTSSDIDECNVIAAAPWMASPCSGRGVCQDEINNFSCECNDGFTGHMCETGNFTSVTCVKQSSLTIYCRVRKKNAINYRYTCIQMCLIWITWFSKARCHLTAHGVRLNKKHLLEIAPEKKKSRKNGGIFELFNQTFPKCC